MGVMARVLTRDCVTSGLADAIHQASWPSQPATASGLILYSTLDSINQRALFVIQQQLGSLCSVHHQRCWLSLRILGSGACSMDGGAGFFSSPLSLVFSYRERSCIVCESVFEPARDIHYGH